MQSNKHAEGRLSDLLEPVTVFSSSDPITRILGYLRESREHEAIIEDGDKVAMVSVRDLLQVENIASEKITRIMKQVPKIALKDSLENAVKVMLEYRIRSLPVYDGEKLVGKITSPSVAKSLMSGNNANEAIARIATPSPVSVEDSDSAAKAKRLMVDRKIDQLLLLKNRRLAGVVTADSIIAKFLPTTDRSAAGERRGGRLEIEVGKLADPQTISNEVTDSIKTTLQNMLRSGSNYSVIMGSDEVQGIVTYHDFIKLLSVPQSVETPVSIIGLPEDPFQSEMAKQKFQSSVKLLSKAWPHLTEARAIIKSGESKAPKKKYEVQVFISSENQHHSYKVVSYDLAKAFEEIEKWIKKLTARYGKGRERRESNRKLLSPNFDKSS
ncbi:MAG: CBS domain-containing protein [Nitrososphaerota archaeon]|nr:CBS domain-containing protein [Nitrososphaerota archaeon]